MGWPDEVIILDESCNIQGPHGVHTDGYPDSTREWMIWTLTNDTQPSAYLCALEWLGVSQRIYLWDSHIRRHKTDPESIKFLSIISRYKPDDISSWPYRAIVYYNLTFATFGYTEGQDDVVLDLLELLQQSTVYPSLKAPMPQLSEQYKQPFKLREPKKPKYVKPKFVKQIPTKEYRLADLWES